MLGAYMLVINSMFSCCIAPLSWCNAYFCHFLSVFVFMYILSVVSEAPPTFFWLPFACSSIFHSFTLSLYLSLELKWVSYRHTCTWVLFFNPSSHSVSLDCWIQFIFIKSDYCWWRSSIVYLWFFIFLYFYCFFFFVFLSEVLLWWFSRDVFLSVSSVCLFHVSGLGFCIVFIMIFV